MLSKRFRDPLNRVFVPMGRALARAGFTANSVTVVGFLIISAGCYLVAGGRLLMGGVLIMVGGLFDSFDGAVAKARGGGSPRGAFLDSTLDRMSDAVLFLSVAWYYTALPVPGLRGLGALGPFGEDSGARVLGGMALDGEKVLGFGLALSCLALAFMTSYIRARAESLGYDGSAGLVERAERVIIVLAGLVFEPTTGAPVVAAALASLFVLSLVTVIQRFVHVWRQGRSPATT